MINAVFNKNGEGEVKIGGFFLDKCIKWKEEG